MFRPVQVFSSDGFMPHGMCYLWQPGVLGLHVASDLLITLSYFSIPFTLLYFVRRSRDLEFDWMFVCFAVFIVACGLTHLMEIVVVWHPLYWVSGGIKALTALASVPTAILLVKLIPTALTLHGERIPGFETVRVRKDGTLVDISATLSPIADSDGKIVGASQIVRDITERKRAQEKIAAQLARLHLLNGITRAIAERHDLASIFQVVVNMLEEQLPLDFGCICLYEAPDTHLTVTRLGGHALEIATRLGVAEHTRIEIDHNGLSRCIAGELVHESCLQEVPFPFPQKLFAGGLNALVAAPLRVESKVCGVLIAARREARSFSSGECEFLRQLSEHVGLAVLQSRLRSALQIAYEDLRQTQDAVMRQEKLRVLGQMASGIAHDINNALSPAALYVESLLERDSQWRGERQAADRQARDRGCRPHRCPNEGILQSA
jgi:GAF domain-containing protein